MCPNALAAKDHGVSCIVGKRRLLSAPCRTVYDQGIHLLNGGDLHLVLRPPKKPFFFYFWAIFEIYTAR